MDQQNTLRANNRIFSIHDPIIPTIQKLLVLYIVVWTIAPPLQIDTVYRLAALGAVGLWFLLNIPYNVKLEKIHMMALGFLLLVIIVALFESQGNLEYVLRPINYYMLIIAFIMAFCYKDRWHELSWLIPVILLLLIYFNYQSYKAVIDDPQVARLIVRNDVEIYHYMRRGVGGYGLLYPQVCCLPMIVLWTIKAFRKNWFRFVIGVVWLVSYYMYTTNSGYTIAVVTSVISLIILFFYKRKSIVLAIVVTAIILGILIWLIGYNDGFRNALISFFDGTKIATKINDIYLSITTDETADSIMSRMVRYQASIGTFFSYPVIGGLWFSSGGGHSAILDTFAKYGLFGGYVYIKIVFGFVMQMKNSAQEKDVRIANALFIAFLMVLLLDSMPYNFTCMLVLIPPICHNDILTWRRKDENSLDSQPAPESSGSSTEYSV